MDSNGRGQGYENREPRTELLLRAADASKKEMTGSGLSTIHLVPVVRVRGLLGSIWRETNFLQLGRDWT